MTWHREFVQQKTYAETTEKLKPMQNKRIVDAEIDVDIELLMLIPK